MYVIVWEFRAKAGHEEEFERVYGPEGKWAQLFAHGEGYLGTELLGDVADRGRYVTIDRWTSHAAFEAFRRQWSDEYRALDRRCEALRAEETALGSFAGLEPGRGSSRGR
jgi:heme-degrading monooxygenase HmoA